MLGQLPALVEQGMERADDLQRRSTSALRPALEKEIGALYAEIDRLVYELYELTPEEIAIVEKE